MAEWKLERYRVALGAELTVRGRFNGQDPQFVHHYENGDIEFWLIVSTDENEPEIDRVFSAVNFSIPGTTVDDAWWIVWCSAWMVWGYKIALLEKMQDAPQEVYDKILENVIPGSNNLRSALDDIR